MMWLPLDADHKLLQAPRPLLSTDIGGGLGGCLGAPSLPSLLRLAQLGRAGPGEPWEAAVGLHRGQAEKGVELGMKIEPVG